MQFNNFLHKFRSTVAYKILGCLAYIFVPFVIYVYRCMVGSTGFGAIGCIVLYFGSCIVGGMAFFIITTIALFCALGKPKTKPNIVTDIGYGIYLLTVIIVLMHLLIYVPLQQQSDKIAAVNFEQDKILIQKIVDEINIEKNIGRKGASQFKQVFMQGLKELVFDMTALENVSSAGLRVILKAQKIMNTKGSMKLTGVNDSIMEVFDITGFLDILTIE